MDRAQGETEFKQALQDFRDAVATGMTKCAKVIELVTAVDPHLRSVIDVHVIWNE